MASRGTLKVWIRNLLGTVADDPGFKDVIIDPIVQQAADAIVGMIHDSNPAYLSKVVTLAADGPTSRTYTFATQVPAVADFARWLEVRRTNETGTKFGQARLDELPFAGANYFDVIGPDDTAVLVTSPDTTAGIALWLRYAFWPAVMPDDNTAPAGIPTRYHDVVALESLFAYGLGGEQARPRELERQWTDRRAQLLRHVSRRGVEPSRTRLLAATGREA